MGRTRDSKYVLDTIEVATDTPMKHKWTLNYSPITLILVQTYTCPEIRDVLERVDGGLALNEHDMRTKAHEVCNFGRSLLGTSSSPESHRFLSSTLPLRFMRFADKSKLARLATQGNRYSPDCSNSATAPRNQSLISTLFPKPWDVCSSFN